VRFLYYVPLVWSIPPPLFLQYSVHVGITTRAEVTEQVEKGQQREDGVDQ